MNRFLLITLLTFISGCASDPGFQGQSQNIVSFSKFKFKSGISGNVPPGLCQIKQLKSEREGYGIVVFSNCNPHTNNKALVTLTYFNLGQIQKAGLFSENKFNNSFTSIQKYDDLNPMIDENSLRILRAKENYIFMANYYVPKGRSIPDLRAKSYLNSILLSVKVPEGSASLKVNMYESVDPVLRPKKRPTFAGSENLSLDKANFHDRVDRIPRPKKRPLIF